MFMGKSYLNSVTLRINLDSATDNQRKDIQGNAFYVIDSSSESANITIKVKGDEGQEAGPLPFQKNDSLETPFEFDQLFLTWAAQAGEWVDIMVVSQSTENASFKYTRQPRGTIDSIATAVDVNPIPVGMVSDAANVSVGTTAVRLFTANANRQLAIMRAVSSNTGTIAVGFTNAVTTTTGFPLAAGDYWEIPVGSEVYAIASAPQSIRIAGIATQGSAL